MIEKITSAICTRLSELFPDHAIYREDVAQGLSPPAITVELLSVRLVPRIMDRYFLRSRFQLRLFPSPDGGERQALHRALPVLLDGTEFLQAADGERFHATDRVAEIQDGTLSAKMNYNVSIRRYAAVEIMQELHLDVGTMGEMTWKKSL